MTQDFNFTPYHVLARTVAKQTIFSDYEDSDRFIFQIYAANIGRPGLNLQRRNMKDLSSLLLQGKELPRGLISPQGFPLVDILSFCLSNDRVHFILSSNIESGISKYMHKLNLAFAKYFNMKHKREGNLFIRPYKLVPLKNSVQLDIITRYINIKKALDVYDPQWKKGVDSWGKAFDFIENYRYSSYADLFGQRKSKILASKEILNKFLGVKNKAENINFIDNYLTGKLADYFPLFLE